MHPGSEASALLLPDITRSCHVLSWFLSPFVLLVVLLYPLTAVAQPADDDRIASATSAAIELSRTVERGESFDLYDRMHPDARNIFSRQAFFIWLDQGGLPEPVDDPVIEAVDIGPWTSPLTGMTYQEAATVRVRQVVMTGGVESTVDAVWTLVADGIRWRWFPDLTMSEIERTQAMLEATPATSSDLRRASWLRIDRFWADVFASAGWNYEPATIVPVTEQPYSTGCGLETNISLRSIYYCTSDVTIYYDPAFEAEVVAQAGAYAITMVVSHEWAHHIQSLLGIDISSDPELDSGMYPIEVELQADCLAGVYAQDALANGDVGWPQIDSAIQVTASAGDRPGTNWDDWDAHGTREQRVEAFQTGFDDGFWGCHLDVDQPAPVGGHLPVIRLVGVAESASLLPRASERP